MMRSIMILLVVCLAPATPRADDSALELDRLFDPGHVVDIHIDLPESDWDRVRFQSRSFVDSLQKERAESPFKYAKGNVTLDGVKIENVGIRKKGFLGSLDDVRPSLKIRFDKYVDQTPIPGIDRLTLNNNKQDPSRLSQFLAYKLYNDSGSIASRANFAKVTVNGKYLGIYSNIESVNPMMLERRFGDGSGPLFEGTVTDFTTELVEKFESKTDHSDHASLRPLASAMAADEIQLDEVARHLDIDAFINFWAMESLIGFWDGYNNNQNNFFVYQNPANSKFYFLPWGIDCAFSYSIPVPPYRIDTKSVHSQSVLANRLYRHPDIQQQYYDTMLRLLDSHWQEDQVLADIDRAVALIENDIHDDNSGFTKAVGKVRSFVKGRRSVLKRELDKWPVKLTKEPRKPVYAKLLGAGTASFKTEWYDKSPSRPETRGEVTIELTYDGKPVTFRQIGVTAEPSKDWSMPAPDGKKPPTVVFSGIRESDGKRLTLALGLMSSDGFRPSVEPAGCLGVLIEGSMLAFVAKAMLNPASLTMIDAQITFDEADMTAGATVSGNVKLRIMRFVGG